MVDRIIEVIESANGLKRLLIVQRLDGCYSFRVQYQKDKNYSGPGHFVWPGGVTEEIGWLPPGPCMGIYDSFETTKQEAFGKVDWLFSCLS